MNIWHHLIFFPEFEKKFKFFLMKMTRKEFTSLNVGRTIDSLLCNLRRLIQVVSSITFLRFVYYYDFKYQFSLDVVVFLIKTIVHLPPLYASKSCPYFVLKLLSRARTFWSNSHFPSTINNFLSPCYPLPFLHQK